MIMPDGTRLDLAQKSGDWCRECFGTGSAASQRSMGQGAAETVRWLWRDRLSAAAILGGGEGG